METDAIVITEPRALELWQLDLVEPGENDVLVETCWSGISSGTERLLFDGSMPTFPGMGYPLVPGYESVGYVAQADKAGHHEIGDLVFIPGAQCYRDARGLFGANASLLITNAHKAVAIPSDLEESAPLLSLAATAHHIVSLPDAPTPELVIGHGVLGRLIVRLCLALGRPAPIVWEANETRRNGAKGYTVTTAEADNHSDYGAIVDASGDNAILDKAIARLATGGTITLGGFYTSELSFNFVPAFMREASIRIAKEFTQEDIAAVIHLGQQGLLSLSDLITHTLPAKDGREAYRIAFEDPACVKMILDWRKSA